MDLNEKNPISIMREDARKTQLEIADLLDIGDQVVRKQELGLTNTPNTNIIQTILEFLPDYYIPRVAQEHVTELGRLFTSTEMSRKLLAFSEYSKKYEAEGNSSHEVVAVVKWYEIWQLAKREEFRREIAPGLSKFDRPAQMSKSEYRMLLMSFSNRHAGAQWFTPYAFCSRLSIHPATLSRWEASSVAHSPVMDAVLTQVDSAYTDVVFARGRVNK